MFTVAIVQWVQWSVSLQSRWQSPAPMDTMFFRLFPWYSLLGSVQAVRTYLKAVYFGFLWFSHKREDAHWRALTFSNFSLHSFVWSNTLSCSHARSCLCALTHIFYISCPAFSTKLNLDGIIQSKVLICFPTHSFMLFTTRAQLGYIGKLGWVQSIQKYLTWVRKRTWVCGFARHILLDVLARALLSAIGRFWIGAGPHPIKQASLKPKSPNDYLM